MDKKTALEVYESLNDEQKELVSKLLVALESKNDILDDAFLQANMRDNKIKIRIKGDSSEILDCLTALIEGILNVSKYDIEEVISIIRYIYYSEYIHMKGGDVDE